MHKKYEEIFDYIYFYFGSHYLYQVDRKHATHIHTLHMLVLLATTNNTTITNMCSYERIYHQLAVHVSLVIINTQHTLQ